MAINLSLNSSVSAPITADPATIFAYVKPVAALTIGLVIYAVLIFKFYKYLARRDLVKFKIDRSSHISLRIFLYLVNQLILVPILIFFWFLVMAGVLLFLSNNDAFEIMIVSMGVIAAIRITSYYNQSLSEELAKLLPLTLAAFFVINLDFSALSGKINILKQMLGYFDKLIFYLVFAVIIELIMRIYQIIHDVIHISAHNRQIVVTSSNKAKKSYDLILDGTFEDLNKLREEEIAKEKAKLKRQQNEGGGKIDIDL